MSYTIVIILIAAIIVAGIAASAMQQHNERKEQAKRDEINKHKNILEETELALSSSKSIPVSQRFIAIMRNRSIKALKGIDLQAPMPELKNRIKETTQSIKEINLEAPPPSLDSFDMPTNDRVIIKYIQAVKRLRHILRSERMQGHISNQVFVEEDKHLEQLQLRINVETLDKRAKEAINSKMQGSARQYLEKAIRALRSFKPSNEYTQKRMTELTQRLKGLENNVRDKNMQEILDSQSAESKELDDLFSPKKKW